MRLRSLILLLGLLCGARARAAEIEVLVTPFQPATRDSAGLSALLHGFLESRIDDNPEFRVIPLEEVPNVVTDTSAAQYGVAQSAEAYIESCPVGEMVGCTLIVGEVADVAFAITGTVEVLSSGSRVQVSIVDVRDAKELLSIQLDVPLGQDDVLATAIERLLGAVAQGYVGRDTDIREDEPVEDGVDKDAVAAELESLSEEIGDSSSLDVRRDLDIDRPKLTVDDIADDMEREGSKPWERVDMSPREYLRYQNSGMNLPEWRARNAGREGQLVLRPAAGFLRAPVHGAYYGRYVRSEDTLAIVQTYAWNSVATGAGITGGGSLGYGVHPLVEVGLTGGIATGHYDVDIAAVTEGQTDIPREGETYLTTSWYVGPRVLLVLMPWSSFRPVVGLDVLLWRAKDLGGIVQLPDEVPAFSPASLVMAQAVVGGEVRFGPRLDGYVHVPLSAVVAGETSALYQDGGDYLSGPSTPPTVSTISAGLLVGFQVKLLGPRSEDRGLDDGYDPEP